MNWDIIGHQWAVELLRNHLSHQRLRHAYLFTGPPGVGRRTLALRFAQAINCTQPGPDHTPCRSCRTCKQTEQGQHPDLTIIQSEAPGNILKVEQIRALQRSLSLAPYAAPYRIALLLRFEEANPSSANALLKTLEEPPPQVILMLTADSVESLLPTVASRCEVLRLRPPSLAEVSQGLKEKYGVNPDEARLLAHISGGRPGAALQFHRHPEALEQRGQWLEDQHRLLAANRAERFAYAEALARNKASLPETLEAWTSLWRDVLLLKAGAASPLTNPDFETDIQEIAGQVSVTNARQVIAELERTISLLEKNVNPRLATEVLMLNLPRLAGQPQ